MSIFVHNYSTGFFSLSILTLKKDVWRRSQIPINSKQTWWSQRQSKLKTCKIFTSEKVVFFFYYYHKISTITFLIASAWLQERYIAKWFQKHLKKLKSFVKIAILCGILCRFLNRILWDAVMLIHCNEVMCACDWLTIWTR